MNPWFLVPMTPCTGCRRSPTLRVFRGRPYLGYVCRQCGERRSSGPCVTEREAAEKWNEINHN